MSKLRACQFFQLRNQHFLLVSTLRHRNGEIMLFNVFVQARASEEHKKEKVGLDRGKQSDRIIWMRFLWPPITVSWLGIA